jgi:hypothetical protein
MLHASPNPAEPDPQATPVLVRSPIDENCAQPAVPPAFDTMSPVVEAIPVLLMVKRVEVADAVDEPMVKRLVFDTLSVGFA